MRFPCIGKGDSLYERVEQFFGRHRWKRKHFNIYKEKTNDFFFSRVVLVSRAVADRLGPVSRAGTSGACTSRAIPGPSQQGRPARGTTLLKQEARPPKRLAVVPVAYIPGQQEETTGLPSAMRTGLELVGPKTGLPCLSYGEPRPVLPNK
ncbi:hypothetical protein DPMN_055346 [Dreissena polymorpha]|uniref:Uncharacterized protein n=1 Tax=Dreissena polymorpha TaxID=45954 RepID=A0A9D4CPU0_DREPO|nr:hypothetical protein DPMN_055346 [Dreissena polymorpha]